MSPFDNSSFEPSNTPPSTGQFDASSFQPIFSSEQSAQALGHATSQLSPFLQVPLDVAKGAGNVALGVAKRAVHTGMELGKLTAEAGSQLPGGAGEFFQQRLQAGTQEMLKPAFQEQGAAQQAGGVIGDIGQFFSPMGEEKATATALPYIEKIPQILGATGKVAKAITGSLRTALASALTGAKFGAVGTAETGDVSKGISAAQTGVVAGGLSGALEAISPTLLQGMMKSGFRLTPQAEAKASSVVDNAAKFMQENKVLGTDKTKFLKLDTLSSNFENTIQMASKQSDLKIPKKEIIDNINTTVEQLRSSNLADYQAAKNDADEAISQITGQTKGDSIDFAQALSNKRSYGAKAFRFSQGGKVADPRVTAEGQYAVELGFQKAIEDTMAQTGTSISIPSPLRQYFGGNAEVSFSTFNKVYSNVINARKLMFNAQFKNNPTLFGRLFTLSLGKMAGEAVLPGPLGGALGMTAAETTAGKVMSGLQWTGERGFSTPSFPIGATKGIEGFINATSPEESPQSPQ